MSSKFEPTEKKTVSSLRILSRNNKVLLMRSKYHTLQPDSENKGRWTTTQIAKLRRIDGGFHKWVVFGASFIVSFLNYGFTISMGAIFTGILETFNAGRAKTAIVQSLLITCVLGLGVVSGFLISKFGITTVTYVSALLTAIGFLVSYFATSIYQLYGFIPVVTGVGIATITVSAVVCVGWTFTGSQKTVVLAVQSVGTALSGFMWPYLLTASIDSYSLKGTCLLLCGIFLNNVATARVFSNCEMIIRKRASLKLDKDNHGFDEEIIPEIDKQDTYDDIGLGRPGKMNEFTEGVQTITLTYFRKFASPTSPHGFNNNKNKVNSISVYETQDVLMENHPPKDEKLFKSKICYLYSIYVAAGVLNMSTLAGFFTVYQDLNFYNGLTISQSNLTFTSYTLLNVLSRLLPLIPARTSNINSFAVPVFSSLCGVVGQLILLTNTSFTSTIVAMAFTAVCNGGCGSSMQAILFEILPREHQTTGYGFMLTAQGVVSVATGPLFDLIRDETSSHQIVLIISAILFFISAILELLCLCISRNEDRNGQIATPAH